jgi:hypothetical protein
LERTVQTQSLKLSSVREQSATASAEQQTRAFQARYLRRRLSMSESAASVVAEIIFGERRQ